MSNKEQFTNQRDYESQEYKNNKLSAEDIKALSNLKTTTMKTTKENNELIAEFMEVRTVTPKNAEGIETFTRYQAMKGVFYNPEDLKYHLSWDWLMPVVEKIEQVNGGVPQQMIHENLYSTINEVYTAVIGFITWYNENK